MSRTRRKLDEELRSATAREEKTIKDWSAGTRRDELLARLHDEINAIQPMRPQRTRPRFRLPVWVAAAVVLVIVAALVAILVVPNPSKDPLVTDNTTSTSLSLPRVATKGEVIDSIAALFDELPGFSQGDPGVVPRNALEQARLVGLITREEAASFDSAEAATRRDLAVWIWRAWQWVLPPSGASPTISDLDGLAPDEVEAIRTVVALGILHLEDSGSFSPHEALTSSQETEAFARLREVLEKR
jgi:hypothetical protein